MSSLYENLEIENQVEQVAAENDGELPPGFLETLVEAQTKSIAKIEGLCKYLKNLDAQAVACKAEKARLAEKQKVLEKRQNSIKGFLVPYVMQKKKVTAGVFTLSTRKSTRVIVPEDFKLPFYTEIVETIKVLKAEIKKSLQDGDKIEGCSLQQFHSLQVK